MAQRESSRGTNGVLGSITVFASSKHVPPFQRLSLSLCLISAALANMLVVVLRAAANVPVAGVLRGPEVQSNAAAVG